MSAGTFMEAGLSLGSNSGDRLQNLRRARRRISELDGLRLVACSPLYETEPVDVAPEYDGLAFLNAVLVVESSVDPAELMKRLQSIETALGRPSNHGRNEPRALDIDIIYAGELIVDDPHCRVPHPRWAGRRFVVQPLADVRPELKIPGSAGTVAEVLLTLPVKPGVILYEDEW